MASVLEIAEEDRFTFRIVKTLIANPSDEWVNSYEFVSTASQTIDGIIALAAILVEFEAAFHLSWVNFNRILVSTWAADSKPYNPETFFSTTLTEIGAIDSAVDQLPLSACLSVARVAQSGRFGHIFYRGCLDEDNQTAPAGKPVLADKPAMQSLIEGAATSSGLDAYIGTGHTAEFVMCMVNKAGDQTRLVEELLVQGISYLPTDHAWFNRTTS